MTVCVSVHILLKMKSVFMKIGPKPNLYARNLLFRWRSLKKKNNKKKIHDQYFESLVNRISLFWSRGSFIGCQLPPPLELPATRLNGRRPDVQKIKHGKYSTYHFEKACGLKTILLIILSRLVV